MEKKVIGVLMALVMSLSLVTAYDPGAGAGTGIEIDTEEFPPMVDICDSRIVVEDLANGGEWNMERGQNYAFTNEKIVQDVVVIDKNSVNKIVDVFAVLTRAQITGSCLEEYPEYCVLPAEYDWAAEDIQVNCYENDRYGLDGCNIWIGEEEITTWDSNIMRGYTCEIVVEHGMQGQGMQGQYWLSVVAQGTGTEEEEMYGVGAEAEYWFMNPTIGISVTGSIDFGTVRPGTNSYSAPILVSSAVEPGSGVMLSMFISGDDFTDPNNFGSLCYNPTPTTGPAVGGTTGNILELQNFAYFATSGAFGTHGDGNGDACADDNRVASAANGFPGDPTGAECYNWIPYENENPYSYNDDFNGDTTFGDDDVYGRQEIMEDETTIIGTVPDVLADGGFTNFYAGNVLAPGADITITFRVALPEPCYGQFNAGGFNFWGRAV